jgi:preprotein translocase subunit SecG
LALARAHIVFKDGGIPLQVLVNILLVVNVFVCIALICVVLLQRSEGGALGMGGGGGPGNFMTARGAGDLLTRITWILAFIFFFISLTETVLSGKLHGATGSIVDHINVNSLDLSGPAGKTPATPAAPASTAPAPALQVPVPQTQAPAQAPADPLSVLGTPTVQSKVLTAPAPQPAPAQPQKK